MSGAEIDFNKLREDGIISSTDQIVDAADVLVTLFDTLDEQQREMIRRYPALVIGLARLAKMDELAEVWRFMASAHIEVLVKILGLLEKAAESARSDGAVDDK